VSVSSLGGAALAVAALACAPIATAGPGCAPTGAAKLLPDALQEASGVAASAVVPGLLWTHNDEGSDLFALDTLGTVLARFTLSARARDPEDLAVAACAGGSCLYLADTGDNDERREPGDARILRVREPEAVPGGGRLDADVFPVRFPEGPRDIEAIFVLPGERVYLVTKGRRDAVSVYRYPGALRADTVTLEEVQRLSDGAQSLLDQVTGASTTAAGDVVAVRTYQALRFFDVRDGRLVLREGGVVNLRPLEEVQGEGVALGAGGAVWLTSEGGPLGGPAALRGLRCRL